jgi:hypothetical protein
MRVVLFTVNFAAAPLKLTAVASPKPVPLRTTPPPTRPEAGVNAVSVTVGTTVKLAALLARSPAVASTISWPFTAPEGTVAVIVLSLTTVNTASCQPELT